MNFNYTHAVTGIAPSQSSVIQDMYYNSRDDTLLIVFQNEGSLARVYSDVGEHEWAGLSTAESYGEYYNAEIKRWYESEPVSVDSFIWDGSSFLPEDEPEADEPSVVDEDYVREKEAVMSATEMRDHVNIGELPPDALANLRKSLEGFIENLYPRQFPDIDTDFYTPAAEETTESVFLVRYDNRDGFAFEWSGQAATESDALGRFWGLVDDDVVIVSVTRYF